MRVFYALLKLNLKIMVQYKTSFLLSLIGGPIIVIINIISFSAIYKYNGSDVLLGYSLSEMIWYYAGITLVWYCIWNSTDKNIADKILSGDLSMNLLKPVSVSKLEFANALGLRMIAFLLEFLPSVIIYSILFYPDFISLFSIVKFLISISLAFILYFLINFLIGLAAFSIKSNYSLQSLKTVIISLAAGALIPLEFFPKWLNNIISALPFQYLFYWPIQVFLNKVEVQNIIAYLKILGFQTFWIVLLFILNKMFWKLAIKNYCAVGG